MNDDIIKAFDRMLTSNETLKAYDALLAGNPELRQKYEAQEQTATQDQVLMQGKPTAEEQAEAERQYAEVESRYKGTDQWLKAPNEQPTNLTERQWVQVRTPNFKKWFGDWEIAEKKQRLEGNVVGEVKRGIIKASDGEKIIAASIRWISENVKEPVKTSIGEIVVDKNSIQNSLSHGFGKDKIDAIPAIPSVLEKGVYIGREKDFGGATINNHYFAGKVDFEGKKKIVFCRVRESTRGDSTKRFYVHEVFTEDEIKKSLPSQTGSATKSGKNTGGKPLYYNLLHEILSVNPDSVSKVVDENGEPLVVYHETQDDFDVFDPTRKTHSGSDYLVPEGVFTKTSPKSINFGGMQMGLFVNIRNPLVFADREQLTNYLRENIENFDSKKAEIDNIDTDYKARLDKEEEIEDKKYSEVWHKRKDKKITEEQFQNEIAQITRPAQDILDEWHNAYDVKSADLKADVTQFFKSGENDGIILEYDAGSFGRKTDAIIAFDPTQIKSATDNVGTFSQSNPSILFQRRIKKDLVGTEEIADYMEDWLNKIGYKTERDYSGLSDSQYITILNYKDMTGKESIINENEEYKIRISTHDLPPSYDGLHGYHDVDVMSENKFRAGNDGRATWYDIVLRNLESEVTSDAKAKFDAENKAPTDIEYPKWLSDPKSIQIKMDEAKSIDLKLELSHLLRGGDWSHYKKPTVTQRKKYFAKSVEQAKDVVNAVDKPPYKKYKEDPRFREWVDFWLTEGGYEKTLSQYNEVKGYNSHSNLLFQSAYHGSGASFDKFDTDFIGTGEGAQAFGWGIYLTQSEGIARDYAKKLGNETPIEVPFFYLLVRRR